MQCVAERHNAIRLMWLDAVGNANQARFLLVSFYSISIWTSISGAKPNSFSATTNSTPKAVIRGM
jgi:hypothetical protein